jgi:transposase-like protein
VTRTTRTPEKEAAFLDALAETASVTRACETAGIARRTAYDWRDADPEFAKAWDAAVQLGTEALEDEAVRRAHHGTDEAVFYQGAECGTVRRYSDTLLIFLLKARRPEKYRERVSAELTGKDGGPIQTENLSDLEVARRVAFLLSRATQQTPQE